MKVNEVYLKAIKTYGKEAQIIMLLEEMSELQKEFCKYFRSGNSDSHATYIAEEIADVEIMLEQMKLIFELDEMVVKYKAMKIIRLQERLGGIS